MDSVTAQWLPSLLTPAGTLVFLWLGLMRGWIHTDREFQDRVREAARIEKFYDDEKNEDRVIIRTMLDSLTALSKAAENQSKVGDIVTKTMAAVQQRAWTDAATQQAREDTP